MIRPVRTITAFYATLPLVLGLVGCSDEGSTGLDRAIVITPHSTTLTLTPGASATVNVTVGRLRGYNGPISLTVEDLPTGVTVPAISIASGQTTGNLSFTASATSAAASATSRIRATGVGIATQIALLPLTVRVEVGAAIRVPVDPYLASPISGAIWEIPVVLLAFIPTADGVNLDVRKTPDYWTLNPMSLQAAQDRILDITRRRKMMVEEGTRFHGFRDGAARPSIGYRVIEHIIVYDLPPASDRTWPGVPGNPRFADYFKIFEELDLNRLIEERGVREVWIVPSGFDASYPSYDPTFHRVEDMRIAFESNMSSPTTGDVSNSFRWNDDLPVLSHTYVVYGIDLRRSQAEAVHNVGHQLEAMLGHVNWAQDGNSDLFWKQFVGQNAQGAHIMGRAGSTHVPPNTTTAYDYLNTTLVPSDIEDWRPAGGTTRDTNVSTWGDISYPWPGATEFGQRIESQWYTYWMQNFPGFGNQVRHGSYWMTNWWAFVADWDAAITSGLGLYGNQPPLSQGAGAEALPAAVREPMFVPVHEGGLNRAPR